MLSLINSFTFLSYWTGPASSLQARPYFFLLVIFII